MREIYDILSRDINRRKSNEDKPRHNISPELLAKLKNNTDTSLDKIYFDNIPQRHGLVANPDFIRNKEVIKNEEDAKELAEALKTNVTVKSLSMVGGHMFYTRKSGVGYGPECRIGPKGAIAIADVLKSNKNITSVSIYNHRIGPEGARALAEALTTNKSITFINIADNEIGDDGVIAIAEVLKTNSTLKSISLDRNIISGKGAKAISDALKVNNTVRFLSWNNNNFGDVGTAAMMEMLRSNKTVREIHLCNTRIAKLGAKGLSEVLKVNTSLNKIRFSAPLVASDDLQTIFVALELNRTLTVLSLNNAVMDQPLAQAFAEMIKINKTLRHIGLNNSGIKDEWAQTIFEALKFNNTLAVLNFYGNEMGIQSMRALSGALKDQSSLKSLNLAGNPLNNESIRILCKGLCANKTLTSLNIGNKSYTKKTYDSIVQALQVNMTLLDFQAGFIGKTFTYQDQVKKLLDRNKSNQKLNEAEEKRQDDIRSVIPEASSSNAQILTSNIKSQLEKRKQKFNEDSGLAKKMKPEILASNPKENDAIMKHGHSSEDFEAKNKEQDCLYDFSKAIDVEKIALEKVTFPSSIIFSHSSHNSSSAPLHNSSAAQSLNSAVCESSSSSVSHQPQGSHLSEADKTAIGKWGERLVYERLKLHYMKKYGWCVFNEPKDGMGFNLKGFDNRGKELSLEVIWENKKGETRKPRDFTIKKNGKERCVEVKTTIANVNNSFYLSANEWQEMNTYGDRYRFFRVTHAGTNTPRIEKIKNPAKKIREGMMSSEIASYRIKY